MLSAIIPVLNEEEFIGEVVSAVRASGLAEEIIVVNDGSTDATSERARRAGARVIDLINNGGKAEAMEKGVSEAKGDILLFMDGDLEGLTPEHVQTIAEPVINGRKDMFIGLISRKQFWLNKILHFFPLISGQRSLRRELWEMVPPAFKRGFRIEIALNFYSRNMPNRSGFKLLSGIKHVTKEKKYGFRTGFPRRIKMMWGITGISCRLYIWQNLLDLMRYLSGAGGSKKRL